jgi:hypothetical protein
MDLKNFYYSSDLSKNKITKNNTIPCHSRKIPLWLVLLDNIPTLLFFTWFLDY